MKLRFIICFVVLFCLKCDCRPQDHELQFYIDCQLDPTTQIDEKVLEKFRQGEKVEDVKIGAHVFCMYKKLNIQDNNGTINSTEVKRYLEPFHYSEIRLNDIIEECTVRVIGDGEIVAVKLYQCLTKNSPENIDRFKLKRQKEFTNASLECQSNLATAVDKVEILNLQNNQEINSSKLLKHILCVMKKVNILDEHGNFNTEVIKKDLWIVDHSKAKIEEIIKECSDKSVVDTEEDRAIKVFKCLRKYRAESQIYDASKKVQERKEKFKKIHEDCQSNPLTKIDEDVLTKFRKGQKINHPQLPHYILCANQKSEIQDQNGNINREILKKYSETFFDDQDKINAVVDECSIRGDGDSAAETAIKVFQCLHKTDHHQNH